MTPAQTPSTTEPRPDTPTPGRLTVLAGPTAVGKGTIDWASTFKAARIGGVKNYFVEQNMDLTKASVAALKDMKA